jgi:mRNA interferase MazF
MAKFVKGEVVILPFPFSDLSGSKKRPALVLVDLAGDDIILCQITSQNGNDNFAIPFNSVDFESGTLPINSFIRPSRIFTADKNIILRKAGILKNEITEKVVNTVIAILNNSK